MLYHVTLTARDINVTADDHAEAERYAREDARQFAAEWTYQEMLALPAEQETVGEEPRIEVEVDEEPSGDVWNCTATVELDIEAEGVLEALDAALKLLSNGKRRLEPREQWGIMDRLHTRCILGNKGVLRRATAADLVGKKITDMSFHLGSYGQGGVGWAGWQLDGGEWLVLPLSGAGDWMALSVGDGERTEQRLVRCGPGQVEAWRPWHHNIHGEEVIDDVPDMKQLQPQVTGFDVGEHSFVLTASDDGGRTYEFRIDDSVARPPYAGSGGPRAFSDLDDLSACVAITATPYLDA